MSSATTLVFGDPVERVRLWALVSLHARSARAGWLSAYARFYAWVIALSQGAILVLGVDRDDVTSASGIVPYALRLLSWTAVAVAWSAARDLTTEDRRSGVTALATVHGGSPSEQTFARAVATMLVVARPIGFPGVCLSILAGMVAPTPRAIVATIGLGLATIGYALFFGFVFGGLARLAARASPNHGRALFAAVVGAPLLIWGTQAACVFSSIIDRIEALTVFG